MSIVTLIMSDGRLDYLDSTIRSYEEMVTGTVVAKIIHEDGMNAADAWQLSMRYRDWVVYPTGERQGFGGAIRSAWNMLNCWNRRIPHVFHLEGDFVFQRPVDLDRMAAVLDYNSYLTQLVLRRQPWNDEERAAGGIVEQHPEDYIEVRDGQEAWLEHRRFFSTNPTLYRSTLCRLGWPEGEQSEGHFTHRLLNEGCGHIPAEDVRFAFWGARDSGEWCTHIGAVRAGTGY